MKPILNEFHFINQDTLIHSESIDNRTQKIIICFEINLALLLIIIPFFSYSISKNINLIFGFCLLILIFNFFSKKAILLRQLSILGLFFYNITDILFKFILLTFHYLDFGQSVLSPCNSIYSIDKTNIPITVVGIVLSVITGTITGGFYLFTKFNKKALHSFQYQEIFESLLGISIHYKQIILSIGLIMLCFGACILPTIIGLMFLLITFIYYYCIRYRYKNRIAQIMITLISNLFIIVIPIYNITNYFINCNPIYDMIVKYSNTLSLYGCILYFYKQEAYYYFEICHCLPFFCFLFGFFFVNLYKTNRTSNQDTVDNNYNIQLQQNKILAFIQNNPDFILHLSQIAVIIWINVNIDIISLILILWLMVTMLYDNYKWFFILTQYFLFPFLFLFFILDYIWNIKGIIDSSNQIQSIFGLNVYQDETKCFSQMTLKLITLTLIGIYIYIKNSSLPLSNNGDIHNNVTEMKDLGFRNIDHNINEDFEYLNDDDNHSTYVLTCTDISIKLFFIINNCLLIVFLFLAICQWYSLLNGLVLFLLIGIIIKFNFFNDNFVCNIIYTIVNISFFSKYITYFCYPDKTISIKTRTELVLLLIYYDSLTNSHYLWIAMYCLYIKSLSRLSHYYSQFENRKLSIRAILQNRLTAWPKSKEMLCIIITFVNDFYIWILFTLLNIAFISIHINLFSFLMILLSLFIFYQCIQRLKIKTNVRFYIKILTISSIAIFALVYIWQIIQSELALESLPSLNDIKLKKYMSLIGFHIYSNSNNDDNKANIELQLLPYISCLILSIALNEEFDDRLNKRNSKKQQFKSKQLHHILNVFLHYYWIVILFVICILSIHWMLSITMLIEIFLLCFFILKSFLNYYKVMKTNINTSLIFKIKQFELEKQLHFNMCSIYQKQYFHIALIITSVFIILSYGFGLLFKFISYDSPNNISVILYLIGIFSDTNSEIGLYLFSWGYFALLLLFSIQAYLVYEQNQSKSIQSNDKDSIEDEVKEDISNINILSINDSLTLNDTLKGKRKLSYDYKIDTINFNDEFSINTDFERLKTDNDNDSNYSSKKSRSNTQVYQKSFIDYSFDLKIVLKKTFELMIIILVFTSALIKMNIVSFCLLGCLIVLFRKELNATKMIYFSYIIVILFIVQYILFISNISHDTSPFYINSFIDYLEQSYSIPWYKIVFGTKWGIFFSCGVMSYQLNSLWIDVILILILYFYLELFSFSIYKTDNKDNSYFEKYNQKLLNLIKMKVMTIEKYHHFIQSMKMSYDIVIKANSIINTNHINTNREFRNKKQLNTKKKPTKIEVIYKLVKQYFFLSFHYFSLLFTLSLSGMNSGVISFGYLTFSLFYMYKSYSFLQGLKWTLGRGFKYFLKPYIFIDLLLQCILQIPFDSLKLHHDFFQTFLDILGLQQLVNSNSKHNYLNTSSLTMVMLKVVILSLVLVQEIIYSSNDFKSFIIGYHIKYYQKTFAHGKLHAFLFNNHRINLMRNSLDENEEIDEVLLKIEYQLDKWNTLLMKTPNRIKERKKMTLRQLMNEATRRRRDALRDKEKSMVNCVKLSFENILKSNWFISFALWMNENNSAIENIAIKDENQIMRILKGELGIETELNGAINKYTHDNGYEIDLELLHKVINMNTKANKNKDNKDDQEESKDIEIKNTSLFIEDNNEDEDNNKEQLQQTKNLNREKEESEFNQIIKDKTFFSSADYYDWKVKIITEFFNSYYSKSKIVLMIIRGLVLQVLFQFDYVCYLLMIMNHYQNRSIISVIYPIIVFSIGLIQYPRPDKIYWKLCIIYCDFIIFLKFFFQLNLWRTFQIFNYFFDKDNIFGIKQCPSNQCSDFIYYILLDCLLLLSLLINQFILIRKGLYNFKEQNYETIEEAYQRIYQSNAIPKHNQGHDSNSNNNHNTKHSASIIIEGIINGSQMSNGQFSFKNLYKQIFPSVRNEKPGKDFYPYYTIIEIITLAYIIIFYTKMDRDKLINSSDILIVKQFSSDSIIFALVQLCLIVLDRYIYLKNVRTIKKRGFKVYNVITGNDVTNEFNINDYDEAKAKCEESEEFDIVSFQYEGPKRALIIKYVVQIISVITIQYFVFWFLPYQGNKNTGENNNTVMSNPFIFIFYFFYCFYFFFSALQIKYGMVDMRKLPTLMKGSSIVNSVIFKVYRAIPFLQELKGFIDWTFTVTALDIFKWLKFEEILALLFINKCFQKSYFSSRVGARVAKLIKRLIGVSTTVGVLVLLFGPLFLFSNLNPSSVLNLVNGAMFKVTLGITEANALNRNFTLINTRNALSIINISQSDYEYLSKIHKSEMKNYAINQIQNISMMGYSETNWDITIDALQYINNSIQDSEIETHQLSFELNFHYSFTNQLDPTQPNHIGYQNLNISNEILKPFFDKDFISCKKDGFVKQTLNNFETNICVSNQKNPKVLFINQFPKSINLYLHCYRNSLFWTIINENEYDQMVLTTYSDKYSSATSGYNVLTFYITFILVVGQFMRSMFVGEATRLVITEMVDSRPLLNVCQGIRISRLKKNFFEEDKLYYVLIDLMRSPELLKTITKSSLQYIENHNLVQESENTKSKVESVAIKNTFSSLLRKAFD